MTKIAHIGDIHISGKNYDRCLQALSQVADIMAQKGCDMLVCSGDIFDHPNISDRHKSVGELQALLNWFLSKIGINCKIFLLVGNHDSRRIGGSSIGYLDWPTMHEDVVLCEGDRVVLGFIPWINKKNQEEDPLNRLKDTFAKEYIEEARKNGKKYLIFGHCDVKGTKISPSHTIESSEFCFSVDELRDLGSDYIYLSHIHKRQGLYVGALYQTNFGEEGNPQGFEIITVGEEVDVEYVEIDIPRHKTLEFREEKDLDQLDPLMEGIFKGRFYSEEVYEKFIESHENEIPYFKVIEKLWNKRKFIPKDSDVTPSMPEASIFEEYMNLNPIPENIERKELVALAL